MPRDEGNPEPRPTPHYSIKIPANRALRTAATEPTVRAAAPGNGIVEPVEPLGETRVVPAEAVPEGAGGVLAAEVVGNGGVTEAEDLLVTASLVTALLVTAALVSSGVELATGVVEATALEVGEATTGVVEAGASFAGAVAAQAHTAEADD